MNNELPLTVNYRDLSQGKILNLPLTRQEANALLRLIAAGTDAPNSSTPEALDRQTVGWLAERILRLLVNEQADELEAAIAKAEREGN